MNRFFALFLVFLLCFNISLPAFSENTHESMDLHFTNSINVNKMSEGETVILTTEKDIDAFNYTIPAGTKFYGKIDKIRHSRGMYIKANAVVTINEMIFPNGQTIPVREYIKPIKLYGSVPANIAKGIVTTPVGMISLALGGVVIVFECITIAGIIFLPGTIAKIGHNLSVTTKGVNKKVSKRKNIKVDMSISST